MDSAVFLALYRARRAYLEAEAAALDAENETELVARLEGALDEAATQPRPERAFRLQVLADVCAKVASAGAVRLLLQILNEDDASVRARARMAYERLASVHHAMAIHGVERALAEGLTGPALLELPGLLLDTARDEPFPLDILVLLLDDDDGDVAAEAACALGELDVPGVMELLSSYREDPRTLSDAAEGPPTLGALVDQILSTAALDTELKR